MIRITTFAGRKVAVFGLGLSGRASVASLLAGGAEVAAWDDGPAGRQAAQNAGIELVDLTRADWAEFAALVLAPGVPLTHPEPHWTVKHARAAGVEVIGDTELFFRERATTCPAARVVGITGTNGKSTTTALTAHVLRHHGRQVQMGGNIGVPILALEPLTPERIYVIEFSSYQIDLTPSLAPTIGVLLNISPDHLERHGTMENYAAIKTRLAAAAKTAVVGLDDAWCRKVAMTRAALGMAGYGISVLDDGAPGFDGADHGLTLSKAAGAGMMVLNAQAAGGIYRYHGGREPESLADLAQATTLRGGHNAQNAAAAVAISMALGLRSSGSISGKRGTDGIDENAGSTTAGLASFPGLAHRMEILGQRGRVLYVNDSKGTNADAAQKALAAFRDIFWIAGGLSKEGGIEPLIPLFPRLAKAYLIGAAAPDFAATLEGRVPFERCATLDQAVARAAQESAMSKADEPVVLLSPACASFDQYPSFAARGDEFRALVGALPGMSLTPRVIP